MSRRQTLRWSSAPAAVSLSLVLASQAVAVTWQPPVPLSAPDSALAGGLVTLGSSTAVAVYEDNDRIFRRRSIDSGMTWSGRLRLSDFGANAHQPSIAGRGTNVDAVWHEADFPNAHIRYARSTNGGRTFSASIALSRTDGRARSAHVARGPNGRVAATWYDVARGEVRLRVSTDGGVTFGNVRVISSTIAEQPLPVVAVGKGVIYAAYFVNDARILVRRSLNNGANWSAPATVGNNGIAIGLDITAAGSRAYVAYVAESATNTWVRYRRTIDKGSNWSSPANLSSATGMRSVAPRISLRGGVLRATFSRCLDAGCTTNAVFYRQSSNGTSWTAAQQASHAGPVLNLTGGVGYAGRIIVLYTSYDSAIAPLSNGSVFARGGTP